ncbi:MAG: hypothetical protein U0Y68_10215 [Blastocatellia bacterium]
MTTTLTTYLQTTALAPALAANEAQALAAELSTLSGLQVYVTSLMQLITCCFFSDAATGKNLRLAG